MTVRAGTLRRVAMPSVNIKLRPLLWKQLRIGTRVVSHAFDLDSQAQKLAVKT